MRTFPLSVGEPAPWFSSRSTVNPQFRFDTLAGRYLILCFFQSTSDPTSEIVLASLAKHRNRFDGKNLGFMGVSTDPDDERLNRIKEDIPGIHYLLDFDQSVSKQFGLIDEHGEYQKITYLLDPRLRSGGHLTLAQPT